MARLVVADHVERPVAPTRNLLAKSRRFESGALDVVSATMAMGTIALVGLAVIPFRHPRLRPYTLRIVTLGGLVALGVLGVRVIRAVI